MTPRCTRPGSLAATRRPITMRARMLLGTLLSFGIVGGMVLVPSSHHPTADRSVRLASESIPVIPDPAPPADATTATATATAGTPEGAGAEGSNLDPAYEHAARTCPGLDPAVLAAIHTIETRKGSDRRVSAAGALGPMQFLPRTWARYRTDGNGDGRADIHNLSDALFTAAHYLCANGGADPRRLASAVWHYNHSRSYVASVLSLAHRLAAA